ncbi:MAG TPA: isoprenylcysteine carboxylmethyltransferase family protein [candidate division Zixibacteria bacterium]
MNFYIIIILISFVWILSEVILARITHSKTKTSKDLDKSSLRFLWLTIIICVFIGVFLGIRGIGFISKNALFISSLGLILIVLGLVVRWTAILTLKKYFTVNVSILSDHRIVDKGIYKIIRHPAYAGSLLSFLGLGLSFSNWLSTLIIFTPVLVVFIYRMRIEEKALVGFFGEKYTIYCKTTKRLIPKIY